jgi:hypothetical protein
MLHTRKSFLFDFSFMLELSNPGGFDDTALGPCRKRMCKGAGTEQSWVMGSKAIEVLERQILGQTCQKY